MMKLMGKGITVKVQAGVYKNEEAIPQRKRAATRLRNWITWKYGRVSIRPRHPHENNGNGVIGCDGNQIGKRRLFLRIVLPASVQIRRIERRSRRR